MCGGCFYLSRDISIGKSGLAIRYVGRRRSFSRQRLYLCATCASGRQFESCFEQTSPARLFIRRHLSLSHSVTLIKCLEIDRQLFCCQACGIAAWKSSRLKGTIFKRLRAPRMTILTRMAFPRCYRVYGPGAGVDKACGGEDPPDGGFHIRYGRIDEISLDDPHGIDRVAVGRKNGGGIASES